MSRRKTYRQGSIGLAGLVITLTLSLRWIPGFEAVVTDASTGAKIPWPAADLQWWTNKLVGDGPSSNLHGPLVILGDKDGNLRVPGRLIWAPWGIRSYSYWVFHWNYPGKIFGSRSRQKIPRPDRNIQLESASVEALNKCRETTGPKNEKLGFDLRHIRLLREAGIVVPTADILTQWQSRCNACPNLCDRSMLGSAIYELNGI